jgi:N6-L-threonylcarbamoyladenine synthase
MIILAIETSCDDTCIAILKIKNKKIKILSNIVSSQVKIHKKYGGVYPFLAKREHQKNLPIVLKRALKGAKLLLKDIDLIAVTVGPGLEPCLWVGVNFAKDLAKKLKLPIVPVNHIEAHIFANFVGKSQISNLKSQIFPAICLVVSGGHTQLILMRGFGSYKILGETRDDAAGECFDKVARILGLGYPGGPAIALQSSKFKKSKINKYTPDELLIQLPRPMIYQKNYDFSFSGLKTAVLYLYQKLKTEPGEAGRGERGGEVLAIIKNQKYIKAMCSEVQQAVIDVLIYKTLKAAKDYMAKTIILGGGVAANKELRRQFVSNVKSQMPNAKILVPPKIFCTDNAVMVAVAGYFGWLEGKTKSLEEIKAEANLRIGQNDND